MAVCTICHGASSKTFMRTYYVPGMVLGPGVLPSIRPHLQVESQLMTEAGTLSRPTKQAQGRPVRQGQGGKGGCGRSTPLGSPPQHGFRAASPRRGGRGRAFELSLCPCRKLNEPTVWAPLCLLVGSVRELYSEFSIYRVFRVHSCVP